MADDRPSTSELEPREPTVEDLRDLCRELNQRQARYYTITRAGRKLLNEKTSDYDRVAMAIARVMGRA